MTESVSLVLAGVAGSLLGAMYFGGLWWTIRLGLSSPRMPLWFLGGLLIRTSLALAGFYFVSDGRWERLLACILGFVAARVIVMRIVQGVAKMPIQRAPEACRAPQS